VNESARTLQRRLSDRIVKAQLDALCGELAEAIKTNRRFPMKKIMLGLVAVFALTSFAAPAFAQDEKAPAADGAKKEKKAKKGKKAEKSGEAAPAEGEKK
jgi:hypothetical protein